MDSRNLSTLCYIEQDGRYLMLHRTVKKHDVNKDKWIGVGGHFEQDESPEECLLREVWEETGYTLTSWRYRAIVTFISGGGVTEYMSLFTADAFTGTPIACDEGELEWVEKEQVLNLNIWEGDKIFFRLLEEQEDFFSLKLVYDGGDKLVSASLDGTPMELFDVRTEDGAVTGVVRERGVAHRDGSLHGTAHIWVVRERADGHFEVLLQKRSAGKDSYPGCYDISAAGHVMAGDDFSETAVRELFEELGIVGEPEQLTFVGYHKGYCESEFYGKPFRDAELSALYVYREPVVLEELRLQPEEVESVVWMDYDEVLDRVRKGSMPTCIYEDEFVMLGICLGVVENEEETL
ncbi:MAG: NUDIX domain-containing protein [Lachnospiraceae bacterium]|nr:NUDIX domain-containing protein [Lachnospiraceae bacterium]